MVGLVLSVSTSVHFFSLSYMRGDSNLIRFFSLLSLFTFFMFFLVVSDNYLVLFVGWEGIGICSFLLISFWQTRVLASKSALKAIILNRIGDSAFLGGISFLFYIFKSLNFGIVFSLLPFFWDQQFQFYYFSFFYVEIISFFFFLAAVGKSAQLGLHGWLPEAMEGERKLIYIFLSFYKKQQKQLNIYYRISVSPAAIEYLGQWTRTWLISFALHGTFWNSTNLRWTCNCPNVNLRNNKKQESRCPKYKLLLETTHDSCVSKTPVKAIIKYRESVGIKYKFLNTRNFSTSLPGSPKSRDIFTLKRKFDRKLEQEVRVDKWLEKNQNLNHKLWSLYSNPETQSEIFHHTTIIEIKLHLEDYYENLTLIVMKHLAKSKERITAQNLPNEISKLQNIFIESFAIAVLAVYEVSKSPASKTAGVDGVKYITFAEVKNDWIKEQTKNTRYGRSSKPLKYRTTLPQKAMITDDIEQILKSDVEDKVFKTRLKILKFINFKSYRKNYQSNAVKRVFIPKKNNGEFRPLDISSIKDRTLQQVINWAILPIAEYQADCLSFGFRPKRSAIDAIGFVYKLLNSSRITRSRSKYRFRKVTFSEYKSFKGKKAKFRHTNISAKKGRRRKEYLYDYYIYPIPKASKETFGLKTYMQYIKVDINKCFDEISHDKIYELTPLSAKYRYFIKSWCTATVIESITKGSKIISYIPTSGVPQGSIIGPLLCNIVLDGLNDYLLISFPKVFKINDKARALVESKTNKPLTRNVIDQKTRLYAVRYADDILILAKCNLEDLKLVQKALVEFLKERGLTINDPDTFQGYTFNSGAKFNYLGFTFILPNPKNPRVDSGKYTKKQYNPITTSLTNLTRYTRSRLLVLIENQCMQRFKDKIKKQINGKSTTLSVKTLIDKVNLLLRGFLNYYNLTSDISKQVNQINDLIHKLFYKFLLRKFSSTPKIYTMIKERFIKDGTFCSENSTLLKVHQIKPHKSRSLIILSPNDDMLRSNIYVDKEVYAKKETSNKELLAFSNLNYGRDLNWQELLLILHTYQKGICELCQKEIDYDSIPAGVEIDHQPAIYELKKSFWDDYVTTNFPEINIKIGNNDEVSKKLIEKFNKEETLEEALALKHEQVTLRLLHKDCNQKHGKLMQNIAAKEIAIKRKALNAELYKVYANFSKNFTLKFKKIRKLNKQQTGMVLSVNFSDKYKTNKPDEFEDIDSND